MQRRKNSINVIYICIIILICLGIAGGIVFAVMKGDTAKTDTAKDKTKAVDTESTYQEPEKDTEVETADTDESVSELPEEPKGSQEAPEEEKPESDKADWNMILVNPWNYLPEDFTVELKELNNGHYIDERAYPDLQAMMDDARAAGLSPYICSSYRTHEYQENLHNRQINKYLSYGYSQEEAEAEASKWVAVAGTSEHQTGLAVDIVASYYIVLDETQEDTPEQKWLMENSYKYGFILRYPNGKTDITGIYYEPWHYRYVGKSAAKEIYEQGITFEEYIDAEKENPDQ